MSETDPTPATPTARTLSATVLEVDMSAAGESGCASCDTTMARVRQAAERVRPALEALGVELRVEKLLVRTEAQARALGLHASPMVRIGGVDLAPEHRRTAAGEASGGPWSGTKRVWRWRGAEHAQPPLSMLVETLLRAGVAERDGLAVPPRQAEPEIPAYVRQFLRAEAAGMDDRRAGPACCG